MSIPAMHSELTWCVVGGGPVSGNPDELLGKLLGNPRSAAEDKLTDELAEAAALHSDEAAPLHNDCEAALLRNADVGPLPNEEPAPLQSPTPCLLPTNEPAPATDLE